MREVNSANVSPVESVLRDELARADRALGAVVPVLGHLLVSSDHALVSDEIVARVRGMLVDLAGQLTASLPGGNEADGTPGAGDPVQFLAERLAGDAIVLGFLHAVAMEAILTERLDQRAGIDPVLSPLWQELIASQDGAVAELAMQALAAQSRFLQGQRRMQHPVAELPPEVLDRAFGLLNEALAGKGEPNTDAALRAMKAEYDEAESRAGLIARLIAALRGGAIAALELEHAGLALFASALAQRSGTGRARAVLACHDGQVSRLALMLRAAGLEPAAIERQFVVLEPAARAPHGLADISVETARALLQQSATAAREAPMP